MRVVFWRPIQKAHHQVSFLLQVETRRLPRPKIHCAAGLGFLIRLATWPCKKHANRHSSHPNFEKKILWHFPPDWAKHPYQHARSPYAHWAKVYLQTVLSHPYPPPFQMLSRTIAGSI